MSQSKKTLEYQKKTTEMKVLNWLWLQVTLNPVRVSSILKQIINVLVVFAIVQWDPQQIAVVNILIGLILDESVRVGVTPNTKVVVATGKRGNGDVIVKEDKLPEGVTVNVHGTGTGK